MPEKTNLTLPQIIDFLPGECWWGGRAADGVFMPFDAGSEIAMPLHSDGRMNQAAPLFISSKGRSLWSERPFAMKFSGGKIHLSGSVHPVVMEEGNASMADALRSVARNHFPASGQIPPEVFFTAPQYNTWIEMTHLPTQEKVLEYARGIIASGLPPGVLMIDAGWAAYWGEMEFHPGRFPDPRGLVDALHGMGFTVMLWVSPFISADSILFRQWRNEEGWLLRDRQGRPAVIEWWDGHSAHLDITHPPALEWLRGELESLQKRYGIDGFKFDAGDTEQFLHRPASWLDAQPVDFTEIWARFGASFPCNELRACWKLGGTPIVQRLHDRAPSWGEAGLASIIPNAIAQGLLGHSFICPDMVGGGDYLVFKEVNNVDEEMFVRWAQASALFPMMQFSCAPWRVLSAGSMDLIRKVVELRMRFVPLIMDLARECAISGEPMLRSMEYAFPGRGYEGIKDQFLLGEGLLVAPVLESGARARSVTLPLGRWRDPSGRVHEGACRIEVSASLDTLPYFEAEQAMKRSSQEIS